MENIFKLIYQTNAKYECLCTISVLEDGQVKVIKDNHANLYGKEFSLPMITMPANILQLVDKDKRNKQILEFIKTKSKINKNIASKLRIVEELIWPKQLYVADQFYKPQKEQDCKELRNSSQTSQQVNIEDKQDIVVEDDQPVELIDSNIFVTMFNKSNCVKVIVRMLNKANEVQMNKGDIGEVVSFAFTCQKAPDGKYIRNYIVNDVFDVHAQSCGEDCSIQKKVIGFSVIYTPIVGKTLCVSEYNKIKDFEPYRALQPENDFGKSDRQISSNIPAVDNSIITVNYALDKLLLVVRQDKIGYTTAKICQMVVQGIEHLFDTIIANEYFNGYTNVDIIYTLAWSPAVNKNKQPQPMVQQTLQKLIQMIQFKAQQILSQRQYRKIEDTVTVSYFVENCLGESVINDSIKIYKELGQQNKGFINVANNLTELLKDKNFKKICNSYDYNMFVPDNRMLQELQELIKIVAAIPCDSLVQRMQKSIKQL